MKCPLPMPTILGLLATQAVAEPALPKFDPADFAPGAAIDNRYLPLGPGFRAEFLGMIQDETGEATPERTTITYAGPGPVIAGVASTALLDEVRDGALLVEQTTDYFAQDRQGNVWYLGEDSVEILYDDDDHMTGKDRKGSWRAGVNGALPGYAMPAAPKPGMAYQQEHSPADAALDQAEVVTMDGRMTIGGRAYDHVLSVFETSALEPDSREMKYYAPGIGLIREEEGLDQTRANPQAHFDLQR